jgi:translation initiation factor 6 (eIF-6)
METCQRKHILIKLNRLLITILHNNLPMFFPPLLKKDASAEEMKKWHQMMTQYCENITSKSTIPPQSKSQVVPKTVTILGKEYDIETTTKLYLTNMNLTEIPKEVFRLRNLEVLKVHHNKLTTLPNDLKTLPKLKKLYIHHNNISSYPLVLNDPNLVHLSLVVAYDNPYISNDNRDCQVKFANPHMTYYTNKITHNKNISNHENTQSNRTKINTLENTVILNDQVHLETQEQLKAENEVLKTQLKALENTVVLNDQVHLERESKSQEETNILKTKLKALENTVVLNDDVHMNHKSDLQEKVNVLENKLYALENTVILNDEYISQDFELVDSNLKVLGGTLNEMNDDIDAVHHYHYDRVTKLQDTVEDLTSKMNNLVKFLELTSKKPVDETDKSYTIV